MRALKMSDLAITAATNSDGTWRVKEDTTYARSYLVVERKLLRFFGRECRLEELAPADLVRWRDYLVERAQAGRFAWRSINTYLSTARAMLNAAGWGELAAAIREVPGVRPRSRAMTEATFRQMVRHANVRDAAIMWLLWESGRRRATICQLRMGPEHLRIYQGPDGRYRLVARNLLEKGERPQLCFAGHTAAMAVSLWIEIRPDPASPWLFTRLRDGEPLVPDTVTHIFREIRRRSQIGDEEVAFAHGCRHAFAQRKLGEYDARVVADWMGISVRTLLQVYATRSEEQLEALFFGDNI